MKKQKILYFNVTEFDDVSYELSLLGNDNDYEVQIIREVPDETFLRYAADAAAVAVDYLEITDELLQQMPECKVIVRRGVGYDNFHLDAFTKNGVLACNVPSYCQDDVALHAVALALSCTRYITVLHERMQKGNGNYDDIKMFRPAGRVFGMMSFGSIARAMVPMLKALGFRLAVWDPYLDSKVFAEYGVEKIDELDDLLRMCDYISVHTPLNAQTRRLLNKEKLSLMKEGSILVCTSRGGIIDEQALREVMLSGRIVGAGIDVMEDEVEFSTPLVGINNAVLTPHVAYFSEEAAKDLRTQAFETMYNTLKKGEYPKSLLNKDVIGNSKLER